MDLRCKQIVKKGLTLESSIDRASLEELTSYVPFSDQWKIPWKGIRCLYIFGDEWTSELTADGDPRDQICPGGYLDATGEWALIVGARRTEIQKYIYRCSESLEELDICFTDLTELIIHRADRLRKLHVADAPSLDYLWAVERLLNLEELKLIRTKINGLSCANELPKLVNVAIVSSPMRSLSFLQKLPNLRSLELQQTKLEKLPDLSAMEKLRVLDLTDSPITDVAWKGLPEKLVWLSLRGTKLRRIPDCIEKMQELQLLDLSNLKLEDLPDWLPELNMDFVQNQESYGIRLHSTKVDAVDMNIFQQPREMIEQWFNSRKKWREKNETFRKWGLDATWNTYSYAEHVAAAVDTLPDSNGFSMYEILAKYLRDSKDSFRSPLRFCLDVSGSMGEGKVKSDKPLDPKPDFAFFPPLVPIAAPEDSFRIRCGKTDEENTPIWKCGRYTPAGCFDNEDWKPGEYRRAYEARKPIYMLEQREALPEEEEIAQPLHEMKIVFLGDGEAGKSHTIARLLADGEQTNDFPGYSTPGIVIQDKTYTIGGREIKVHFWDFGGQEILHSMHRMFLTERTLYVVVLNVREGNQDERARYWLHNLRSFANGAPVLLVLNKMDMNKNASINESDLRAMYPGLTEVVKLSALTYTREEFENSFLAALKRQVGAFEYLESPFLPAWSRLKEALQNMTTSYIRGAGFRSLCDTCGVKGSDDVRRGLLNWFSDLGVSFCYSGGSELEDYVVLRPDWITNAIYILLFNKITEIKNGLVTHDTIYRMLQSGDVERTVPGATYAEDEVAYVLNVIRKFRLSFRLEENTEFLPMLCDANAAPVAEEYAADPDALEFRMEYEYLPGNVLHRLMVERRRELDLGNVWLTGARFVYGTTGLSAVVKSEGELLRILVRSENADYEPQRYLDELKEDLLRINETMGLKISGMKAAYKSGGIVEYFDYDDLLLAQELGDRYVRSRLQRTRVALADILKQSDYPEDEKQKRLIRDIRLACEKLQDRKMYWNVTEDDRTDFIRDLLTTAGYTVLDQHRGGVGAGGERAGELDLDIRLTPDASWTVFEALNLKGSAKSYIEYWDAHLKKLLDNYNAIGRAFLFHVSYVECRKEKFAGICSDLREHMRLYSPAGFEVLPRSLREVPLAESFDAQNRFMRAMKCVYDCGGAPMTVYHFFVRMGGEKEKEEMA